MALYLFSAAEERYQYPASLNFHTMVGKAHIGFLGVQVDVSGQFSDFSGIHSHWDADPY